jgi:diguanylate cyclase
LSPAVDIDDFKKINDQFGHEAGDKVIQRMSQILQEGIRTPDLAARIGGDEFALLLVETNAVRGLEVADRLRQTIKATDFSTTGSETIRTTASFGLVEAPLAEQTTAELLGRQADAALYEAKRQGRDQVVEGNGKLTVSA